LSWPEKGPSKDFDQEVSGTLQISPGLMTLARMRKFSFHADPFSPAFFEVARKGMLQRLYHKRFRTLQVSRQTTKIAMLIISSFQHGIRQFNRFRANLKEMLPKLPSTNIWNL